MRQLSQNLRTGKLSIDEVPMPTAQAGQVLVKTAYSIISAGTERTKIETGRKSLIGKALARPDQVRQVIQSVNQSGLQATYQKVMTRLDSRSPLGYSAAGIVLCVSPDVQDIHPGDAVACGGASAAHAEIICVPKNLCVPLPKGVDLDGGSFATIGAIALQGIRQAELRLGESALVIGLGLLGQLTVQMLKAAGCTVIGYDLDESRCRLAVESGADTAAFSEGRLLAEISQYTDNKGVDAVLITAGTSSNQPVTLAGQVARDKGRVVVVGAVGLTVPRAPYYDKELELRLSRSYGPGRYDPNYEEKGQDYPYGFVRWTEHRNMAAFLSFIAARKVDVGKLITHRFSLDQADHAYAVISGDQKEPCLAVLFDYGLSPVSMKKRIENGLSRPSTNSQVRVGVIGAGNFAQSMLLPHLKTDQSAALAGVATLYPLESRDVADRFGFQYAASDPDEIIENPDIQAVIIATRHDSHADLVIRSLNAGKAIHVEKPLAMNPAELKAIEKAYIGKQKPDARNSSFLQVGFNRRFAPMVQSLVRFFSDHSEPFSMLYRINAGYITRDHWTQDPQQGGGRIIGEVCHFVDLLQYISGSSIKQVHAFVLPNHGKYSNDNVSINLSFMDGSAASVLYLANGDKSLPKEYIEVFCAGKTAVLEDYRRLSLIKGGKKLTSSEGARDKGHKSEMNAWIEAIQNGKPEPVPFSEAAVATRASFAILDSITSGNAVGVSEEFIP
jgi:predicted dehydrogenase/threonine dehydrogenase-like Zn-dependent dehydrogenase